jgi:hypothetical protein
VDFCGGPRDGDRIVVEGQPETFEVPVEVEGQEQQMLARYELRDGAYHYVGQVPEG